MPARKVEPSASAVERRRQLDALREERVPAVALELANKIVDSLEPSFSTAYLRREADTFEDVVFKFHSHVFDRSWLSERGITTNNVTWFPPLFRSAERLIKEQLRSRYDIVAEVYIRGGGDWETSVDWYVCDIRRPIKKRHAFWYWLTQDW